MPTFSFQPVDLPPGIPAFRQQIRQFLQREMPDTSPENKSNCWGVADLAFSRKLGQQGYIGMTWPKAFGGGERSAIERYILLEELLAAGAPVGAHWIADRQSGPAILKYGTAEQQQKYLPAITRGELYCCIGMSEPGAGSDLASVRTRGEQLADGRWKLNGQKLWTTFAQHCDLMIALVRTTPVDANNRHAGLSQFLIDLKHTPGITIRPIEDMVGGNHFNEVFFDDAIVEPDALFGVEGEGWQQCTSELSLERSGPERYLSSLALYLELLRAAGSDAESTVVQALGSIATQLWTLRQMSLSVAGQLVDGQDPTLEAACVKDLGNALEQGIPHLVQRIVSSELFLEDQSDLARTLALLLQTSPSFSLRGGTREILRGIIARGLGLR
ncbi:MAG: acyl-CoA dehydrogenase [Halieaceae bacterium]|jgi:alkylation response protein AidB-like acyl-CoA dehydrogenase|nr:acyl-CoA dehydrogenase [Halieaceae bacterium]